MAKQMLYTPAQLRNATPEQRRQMKREITERNLRDHADLYARLAPFDGPVAPKRDPESLNHRAADD